MIDSRQPLLTVARAYSDASGRSLARVSHLIHNSSVLFKKLEEGGTCTLDTYDKAMRWFSDNWPAELPWPDGIVRPAPRTATASEAA